MSQKKVTINLEIKLYFHFGLDGLKFLWRNSEAFFQERRCSLVHPCPWIFGTVTERHFWKKSKITGDVTNGTLKIKIICADKVPAELSYDTYFKWHTPIWEELWRAEQKYMPFFGTINESHFRWKIQSKEKYINNPMLRSGFFSANQARWWSRVLDFFQDKGLTDKG